MPTTYTAEDTAARGGVLLQDLEDGALEGVKAVRKVEESARREESGSREREGGSGSFTLYPTALYSFKVVDSGFFLRGACLEGLAEPTPQRNCVYATPLVRVESTGVCFQSLARRSRYSIRPLKFECDCFLTQNAFSGTGTARHFGPNSTRPAQIWPYACVPDPDRSEPSREGRLDVRRSVAGPLSAASARYLPIGDSDFGAVNKTAISRNGDIESLPNR